MPRYNVYGWTKIKWRKQVEADSKDDAEEIARDNWESADVLNGDTEVFDIDELEEN